MQMSGARVEMVTIVYNECVACWVSLEVMSHENRAIHVWSWF